MKTILFSTFLLFASYFHAISQRCGTYDIGDGVFSEINGDANATYDIRTYWYWVRDDDGSSTNSEQLVKDLIELTKTEFASIGIHLKSSCASGGDNFRTLDDTFINNANTGDNGAPYAGCCFLDGMCNDDGLNIFITKGTLNGVPQGLASLPGNRLFVSVDEIGEWESIVHEIGHCFGLFHTYAGRPWAIRIPDPNSNGNIDWECTSSVDVSTVTPSLSDCNQLTLSATVPRELVNGSNATIAGDFVADTPGDIDYRGVCGTDIWDCNVLDPCNLADQDDRFKDPNCDPYAPDYSNFMGARVPHCTDHFTPGQISRMKGVIATRLPYMIIKSTPTINALDCSTPSVDLNTLHDGPVPYNVNLVWSTDDDPSDGLSNTVTTTVTTSDTYYAYYYFINEECYGPPSQGVTVEISNSTFNCRPCGPNVDIIAQNNQPLSGNEISGDLIIPGGITLTINQTIQFSKSSRILVKPGGRLVVAQGGVLTKCPQDDLWEGIIIEGIDNTQPGFSYGGEVEIRDGGIVEYAAIGVKKSNQITGSGPNGLQSVTPTNVGKLTITNGGYIRYCEVGAELLSTGGSTFGTSGQESSSIQRAFFEKNKIDILLRGNRGLSITDSDFLQSNTSIEINRSYVDIRDNDFRGVNKSIFINNAYPSLMGTHIENNTFIDYEGINGGFSVYCDALSNAEYLNIIGNTMMTCDLHLIGISTFQVANNDIFYGFQGITSSATGPMNPNFINDNFFFGNYIGNNVDGINNIEYLTNCFQATDYADIGMGFGARIKPEQGNDQFSAGNCFHYHTRIRTMDSFDPNTAFKYYTKDGILPVANNCKTPGTGNFTVELANNESESDQCGSGAPIFGNINERYRDCQEFIDKNENAYLLEFIQDLEAEILFLQQQVADGLLNVWVAKRLIDQYQNCLDQATKRHLIHILESSDDIDREEAVLFLTERKDFSYHIMAYALLLDMGELPRARALLDNLTPDRADEVDFIEVQGYYLDYLTAPDTYELTDAISDRIFTVGEERLPLSGFARAVYHRLTGDRHFITVPTFDAPAAPRTLPSKSKDAGILLYPNPSPADASLHVELPQLNDPTKAYTLEIYTAYGERIVYTTYPGGQHRIPLDLAHRGLLFVRIQQNQQIVHTERLIRF